MKYRFKSRTYEIDALQFQGKFTEVAPDWLLALYKEGRVSCTVNGKAQYFTIYDKNTGDISRGYAGDWICRNKDDYVYKVNKEEFKKRYE